MGQTRKFITKFPSGNSFPQGKFPLIFLTLKGNFSFCRLSQRSDWRGAVEMQAVALLHNELFRTAAFYQHAVRDSGGRVIGVQSGGDLRVRSAAHPDGSANIDHNRLQFLSVGAVLRNQHCASICAQPA